jgi:endonuclease III
MPRLARILDTLESHYGVQAAQWPTDPYLFLVWWHCGYPPSEERCARGWEALNGEIGVSPEQLSAARSQKIARALTAGGIVAQIRATRLKAIAAEVRAEFAGDLRSALGRVPLREARALLKKFPGIGNPGADRILLFAEIAPVPAVPSSCPHVPVRIESGPEPEKYDATYALAQRMLGTQMPETCRALSRAYLLLQVHGRQLCKRTNPKCSLCPVAKSCAFLLGGTRRRRKAS